MKRRIVLATISADSRRFSLSIELLAAKIYSEFRQKIQIIKYANPTPTTSKEFIHQILKSSPQMVAFSCYVWNMTQILEVAKLIKRNLPDTLIVLGGPETEGIGGEILEKYPYIDGVVMGEGEETFAQMIAGWLKEDKLVPIPGAVVRMENRIYRGGARPPIDDLDKIPSPYDDIKLPAKNANDIILPIQTLRGCTRRCSYCYWGKNFSGVRFFSRKRISEDLEKIKKHGVNRVLPLDSNLFCNTTHASGVIRLLSEKGMTFQLEARANDLDEEIIDLLVDSTCIQVSFGLQSSNPKALKQCGRSINLKQFATNVRRLAEKAANLVLKLDLIYGLPGDTLADFLESIDFALSLPLTNIKIYRLRALPGTLFYEQPARWGIRFDPDPPHLVYESNTFTPKDIKQAGKIVSAVLSLLLSCDLKSILRYVLRGVPDPPSRFFTKLIAWDQKQKKWFVPPDREWHIKKMNLVDIRYFLSGVHHIYPGIFSADELEFIMEWYRLKLCFIRLAKKESTPEDIPDIPDGDGLFWKCSDNIIMKRFRIAPRIHLEKLVPEPLLKERRRFVLQKGSKGMILIYEVSEGIEKLLKYFRQPKVLSSYLTAPGSESAVERHIRIQYAKEKGFIRAVNRDEI